VALILLLGGESMEVERRGMSTRALVMFAGTGLAVVGSVAALLIFSIRTGVAPVTIPIFVLVLGPALAATALVTTCSMVAPPPRTQPLMRAIDLTPTPLEEVAESVG
jgi:hypothetical protein